jgi:hypothetical protein
MPLETQMFLIFPTKYFHEKCKQWNGWSFLLDVASGNSRTSTFFKLSLVNLIRTKEFIKMSSRAIFTYISMFMNYSFKTNIIYLVLFVCLDLYSKCQENMGQNKLNFKKVGMIFDLDENFPN